MAATSTTETYDALWTLTMRAKRRRLTDNISDSYPTVGEFRKSGIMEVENGGKQIQEDLMYALASAQYFDTYDVLDTARLDGITAAHYDWAYLAAPIVISDIEDRENRASDKAIKLIEAKTRQAMQGALDQVNSSLLSAQSGKSILGLQDVIKADSANTVGGINASTESWWDNQRLNYATEFSTNSFSALKSGTNMYNGTLAMSELWNACSEGNDQPDIILTTYGIYGGYEEIFESTGNLRLTPKDRNDLDGRTASFRGASVIPDRDAPTDSATLHYLYMINKKYLKFKIQSGMNFAKTPFERPANQLAKVAFVVMGAQLTSNHRQRLGVLHEITP